MPNSLKLRHLFVTDGRTNSHLRLALLSWLWRVDLKNTRRWTLIPQRRGGCLCPNIVWTKVWPWPLTSNVWPCHHYELELIPVSFIMTVQVGHEIWCSQDLTSTTLNFDAQNQIRSSVGANECPSQFYQNCSSRSWDMVVTISDRTNGCTNGRTNETD